MAGKVCPHWVGYLLASPLRRLFHNPRKILGPYVEPGMTVLDIGCAMGFFSLPLARMIGKRGKVVCVDAQENMLVSLQKRARKAGLADRIIPHLCPRDSLSLEAFANTIDFSLAFAVVHEVPDPSKFFAEVWRAMKAGSKCLVAEPKGRVSVENFVITLAAAGENGLRVMGNPEIARSRAALLVKKISPSDS